MPIVGPTIARFTERPNGVAIVVRMRIGLDAASTASRRRLVLVLGLLVASTSVVAGIGARAFVRENVELSNLVWNLFLAWVPFVLALLFYDLARLRGSTRLLVGLGALWLVFLPNAPYIVTDVIILDHLVSEIAWYDAVLVVAAAAVGLALGFVSLYLVQAVVAERLGKTLGWLLAAGALVLSGIGVYLGRFQRWNSWEVLTEPTKIASGVGTGLLDPLGHTRPLALSAFFAVASCTGYVLFTALLRPHLERLER